jgi:hypothetical protein
MEPRVFVSSVVEEFGEYRAAAAQAISECGCEPILVNEDLPAVSESSRNACLDLVASCDALVLIIGSRGGWLTPSGQFVIEEEYLEARRLGRPTYVFLQSTDRDQATQAFVDRVSDYISGHFRREFASPPELSRAIVASLKQSPPHVGVRMIADRIFEAIQIQTAFSNAPMLRVVIGSLRDEEMLDELEIHRNDFQDRIIQAGMIGDPAFFGLRKAQEAEVKGSQLVLSQSDDRGSNSDPWYSEAALGVDGVFRVETSIRREVVGSGYDFEGSMMVLVSQVERACLASFGFLARMLDVVDKNVRHRQFEFNAGVQGLNYRLIVDSVPSRGHGIPMGSHGERVVTAFDAPKRITREALAQPKAEAARVAALLKLRSSS